jgi:hypothetical protein
MRSVKSSKNDTLDKISRDQDELSNKLKRKMQEVDGLDHYGTSAKVKQKREDIGAFVPSALKIKSEQNYMPGRLNVAGRGLVPSEMAGSSHASLIKGMYGLDPRSKSRGGKSKPTINSVSKNSSFAHMSSG